MLNKTTRGEFARGWDLQTEDGQYELYIHGEYIQSFSIDTMDTDILDSMVVIVEGE